MLLALVVVVVVNLTCDGKYFHDQLALSAVGAGWAWLEKLSCCWEILVQAGGDTALAHHHHHHQEGRGKHLYPTYHLFILL